MAATRSLLLLLAQQWLCAPAPVGGAVTWFSFYDFWIDTDLEKPPYNFNFSQAAQFINLPTVDLGANLQDWKNFARWQGLGGTLDVMWDVEKAGVFTPPCAVVDCSKVERSGLAEGWEAKLDHAIIEAKALEYGTVPSWSTVNISTRAWFLGDELLENGIPIANLTAVARHIKKQWGAPTKVYANLCMPSFIDAANQVRTAAFSLATVPLTLLTPWHRTRYPHADGAVPQPSSPSSTCTGAARCAGGRGMPGGCCLDGMLPAEIDYISFDFCKG